MSVVTVEEQSGVALVTLNRPDANNALNRALSEAITETFIALASFADGARDCPHRGGPQFLRWR